MLAMLLPNTLPIANSELPSKLAKRFTTNSGILVPKDTMVSPITNSGILFFFATEEAPSTNQSAPLISKTKPIKKST